MRYTHTNTYTNTTETRLKIFYVIETKMESIVICFSGSRGLAKIGQSLCILLYMVNSRFGTFLR